MLLKCQINARRGIEKLILGFNYFKFFIYVCKTHKLNFKNPHT